MQYLELIVPEDKIQSGICKHAPECESKEKLAAKWGKSITLRYKQNHCCRTHTAQRYALAEIFNVLGQLKTIERVKKSGEMIYNKKEQLTSDLGAKEK